MLLMKIVFVGSVAIAAYTIAASFCYIIAEDYYLKKKLPVKGNYEYSSVKALAAAWPFTLIWVIGYVFVDTIFTTSYRYLRQILPRRNN